MFKFKTLKIFSLTACLLLFTTASCSITSPELTTVAQERDKAIAEIPILPKVDYIQTFRSDWSNAENGGTCYYTRGYLVFATKQSIEEVRKTYRGLLQEQGWMNENQKNLGLFIRGQHERINIAHVAQGTWIDNRYSYPSVMDNSITRDGHLSGYSFKTITIEIKPLQFPARHL